jgi:hypothetical protein
MVATRPGYVRLTDTIVYGRFVDYWRQRTAYWQLGYVTTPKPTIEE